MPVRFCRPSFALGIALLLLVLLSGCGPSAPRKVQVTGTVTLDGTPLPTGNLLFALQPQGAVLGAGDIKEGAFSLQVPPGSYKVQVTASRAVPGQPHPDMGTTILESILPAEYNSATTLTAIVTEHGGTFTFPLQSRGRPR